MALINNPNVYTGGNVVFDNSRGLDLAAQLQAKKAAKDEALNQYFNDLPNKINTAGVRKQDLDDPKYGGINREIEAWRTNWLQNKDAIKKGGIPQQEHLGKFQEILRKIEQSKQRAKTEFEIGKAKFEGKYDPDEDDIGVLSQIGKSIYDPTSYKQDGVSEYGWGDLSPAVPEFDADKQTKFWAGITKGLTPGKMYDYNAARTDAKTGQVIVPFKKLYQPDQVKRIADEAADAVTADKSARKFYKKILDDPQSTRWQELNKAYQSVYGTDKIVSTPEQAAAADAIIRASMPQEQGEEQELNRQQANINVMNRIYANKGGVGSTDFVEANEFDRIPSELKNLPNKDGVIYNKDGSQPFTGEWAIVADNIPSQTRAILKSGGIELKTGKKDTYWLDIRGGQIKAIKDKSGNTIADRTDMENAQKKWNTEGKTAPQPVFGDKRLPNQKPTTPKPKKDPLGLGL